MKTAFPALKRCPLLPLPSFLLRYIKGQLSPLFQNNRQLERQESISGEREVAHNSIGTRSLGTQKVRIRTFRATKQKEKEGLSCVKQRFHPHTALW